MKRRRKSTRPTEAELAILQVLWGEGPCTVREVQEHLSRSRPSGYTTILKLMQIMADKGLVTRDVTEKAHRYAASGSEEQTQNQLVGDLLNRAFQGSAGKLVLQALSQKEATPEELAEIRRILDRMQEGGRR